MPTEGTHCLTNHGNAGPCTWHDGQPTRPDQMQPCPYDQSNHSCWPPTN